MATLGVYRKLSPTLLPLFPPPGVTAQVHWVLAGTLLSGKCAAEYLVHLHPLICGHIRCEENLWLIFIAYILYGLVFWVSV